MRRSGLTHVSGKLDSNPQPTCPLPINPLPFCPPPHQPTAHRPTAYQRTAMEPTAHGSTALPCCSRVEPAASPDVSCDPYSQYAVPHHTERRDASVVSFVLVPSLRDPFDTSLYGAQQLVVSVGGKPLDGSPFTVNMTPADEYLAPSAIEV